MNSGVGIVVTVALLALNAFFVAAEFAIVSARRAGVEPAAEQGSRRALTTLQAMENVSSMLAGAQLGITVCSIALGAVSEPAIAHLLEPAIHALGLPESSVHPIAFTIALLLVTLLHVVLGEMVPKNVALAAPERSAIWLSPVLAAMVRILRPLIWLLNGMANVSLRLVRVRPKDEVASAFTRDEVADMIEESHRGGLLPGADRDLLGGVLAFDRATAGDVLIPMARVHTLGPSPTPAQVEALAARTGVTRFPLRTQDGCRGYVHLKDLLALDGVDRDEPVPASVVRALPQVPADLPLAAAIEAMRAAHAHLAVVTKVVTEVVAGEQAGQQTAPVPEIVGVVTLDDIVGSLVQQV